MGLGIFIIFYGVAIVLSLMMYFITKRITKLDNVVNENKNDINQCKQAIDKIEDIKREIEGKELTIAASLTEIDNRLKKDIK